MKKWLMGFAGALMVAAGFAQAQNFEEGVHYEVVADEATSKPEIAEFSHFTACTAIALNLLQKKSSLNIRMLSRRLTCRSRAS